MDGWLIAVGLIVAAAVLLATGRGWWLGLPASVGVTLLLLIIAGERGALAGPLVALMCGAVLPAKDRIAAIPIGIGIAAAFLLIVPSGADSPVSLIVAACAGAFAIGASIGSAIAAARHLVDLRRARPDTTP